MTVTLPIAAGIRMQASMQVKARTKVTDYASFETVPDSLGPPNDRKVIHYLEIGMSQRMPESEVDNPAAMAEAKRRAVRVLMSHVYGPVEREATEIVHMLYEDGLYDHPATKRLLALLPVLKGDPAP